jgi:aminotransferase
MRDRTVTINGLSKTYSVTGWRVGYVIAPPKLSAGIRKVHDFLTVGAAAPLQEAGAAALKLPESYYAKLARDYQERRDVMVAALHKAGFTCASPLGAYYVMAGIDSLTTADDVEFAQYMVKDIGVAAVPGSSFFHEPSQGAKYVRFCFCKRLATLRQAAERLERISKPALSRKE